MILPNIALRFKKQTRASTENKLVKALDL